MNTRVTPMILAAGMLLACAAASLAADPPDAAERAVVRAEAKAWEGTVVIPTYTWEDDINPKFWALDPGAKEGAPPLTALIYPYTMQDFLSRTKVDRTYKALFLENEYLKVTCLPELGGRLHSVLDKTTGQDMFHLNHVIKPSMIGMRGAWISGGVEWNAGPQGHTVTCVSPVDALAGQNDDGSAYLEVANLEKTRRTRWTVRLTLHPGRAYLDERIRLFNPNDTMAPYYFWNCTAFPCRPGTRFIFPMSLGTDHSATTFFTWPIHEGRDLTWLKNYEVYTSIFARDCVYDFFGAYDVDADRGLVQAADHFKLGGKKAWTWGQWDFGLVAQKNLTDDDGPYIEVQSGPLPTQSDYGALWPHEEVTWQEWWYPVHGLGDGFEFATRDVAIQTTRKDGQLELRLIATGKFPGARCTVSQEKQQRLGQQVDLAPEAPQVIAVANVSEAPVEIAVTAAGGELLALFTSPLPIPKVNAPSPEELKPKPDDQLTAEELYLRGRKQDLATNRVKAREYYEKALVLDAGYVPALRGLAVLAVEAGDYASAVPLLERAVARDPNDGLSWYFLGVSHFKLDHDQEALRCAHQAARCLGTASIGDDLAGRAYMRLYGAGRRTTGQALAELWKAVDAFAAAGEANSHDPRIDCHWLLTLRALEPKRAVKFANERGVESPTALLPRAVLALQGDDELKKFGREVRGFVGEIDFELLETCFVFADVGLYAEALRLLEAVSIDAVPAAQRSPLALYHLAYWAARLGDEARAQGYLQQAGALYKEYEFAADPDSIPVLEYAVEKQADDANARFHLGNLYAHLGRLDAAAEQWQKAVSVGQVNGRPENQGKHDALSKPAVDLPYLNVALRNLGLYYRVAKKDLKKAADYYRQAIAARPTDQTLYRDLAEILIADGQRPEAVKVLETMPTEKRRRADVLILLAQAYLDEQRFDDVVHLLEETPYFVAWEGQATTWILFNQAHLGRGRERFEKSDFAAALQDFDAAMTYPANLGVGRSNKPEHAPALYWRGKALAALGRKEEARQAWQDGAAGSEGSPDQNQHRDLCRAALGETK